MEVLHLHALVRFRESEIEQADGNPQGRSVLPRSEQREWSGETERLA